MEAAASEPPLPAVAGLFGQPTLIHNVISLASVPVILARGAAFYRDFGTGRSRGTLPMQLAGNLAHGGLVELAFGCTIRELLGTGALFANMQQLLPFASDWTLHPFNPETPFLLAILPPGAFLVLGFLIALKNVIDKKLARSVAAPEDFVPGSKRARVTGQV